MEKKYCIRRAILDDRNSIIEFVNREWKKSQTLNDDKLFKYYFVNDKDLNIFIATREDEIVAVCGFVRAAGLDVWGSNLLIKKGEEPTLFFRMIKWFAENGYNLYGSGIEKYTQELYKLLGYKVKRMKHYYKLFDRKEYKIAEIINKQVYSNMSNQYKVLELDSERMLRKRLRDSIFDKQRPQKSYEYIIKRYYHFPYSQYQYRVWAIEAAENSVSTLFVTREQSVEGEKILRVVDIIGSETELLGIGSFFEEQGRIHNYEYIDCWCYGIDDDILKELGFFCCDNDDNIIPDRLEPLEKCNEEIFLITKNDIGYRAFRADGDMDRPNLNYND